MLTIFLPTAGELGVEESLWEERLSFLEEQTQLHFREKTFSERRGLMNNHLYEELRPLRKVKVEEISVDHDRRGWTWEGTPGEYTVTVDYGYKEGDLPAILKELVTLYVRKGVLDPEVEALLKAARRMNG